MKKKCNSAAYAGFQSPYNTVLGGGGVTVAWDYAVSLTALKFYLSIWDQKRNFSKADRVIF